MMLFQPHYIEVLLIILGLITVFGLFAWRLKFLRKQNPNSDLLMELWKKVGEKRG